MADLIAARFLRSPNRTYDFGVIDAATAKVMGARPGPIRLQHGYEGPKGFGNRHVEAYANRMKQLAQIGFTTFSSFSYEVAQNYTRVFEGDPARRSQIVHRAMYDGRRFDLKLVIEPAVSDSIPFFTIVTGIFAPIVRGTLICEVARTDGSVPTSSAAEERPRFETLSLPKPNESSDNGS